jgi:serine/threonine protein kinase/formylglycine-generating enzyme required for sulfatase activity
VDETRSPDGLPDSPEPEATPPKMTLNTGAIATDLAPGESRAYPEVSGYEVLGILGHGGMGLVYRARQLKANRLVAIKMIRAVEHATPQERLRFEIETEAVARLQHPHIVQLYEVGEVRGQPFFSLEFCEGGTLTDQLKKKRPTPREAAELIETLARAMHYAHLRGVVHRDLKPGNVLLTADGTPKITDFGLAKRIGAEARDVSQSGAIMGTAAYMAPEQAAGKVRDTGPAADVYALGALLYECLTGQPPFVGPQHVVLVSVLNDEPLPPSRRSPKVPRDLETICLKCLTKDPNRRYASAEALAEDLRRFLADEPVLARPVGRTERMVKWVRRHPAPAALLGVVLLALVLLSVALVSVSLLSSHLTLARNDAEQQKTEAENKSKEAEHQKGIAEGKEQDANREAAKARKAREFLVNIFELSDRNGPRGTMTARQILDAAEKSIPDTFRDQPELQKELKADVDGILSRITADAPLAMILVSTGPVEMQTSQKPDRKPQRSTLLYAGDRLTLGADAHVEVVILRDLHQERLQPGGTFTVQRKGCEPPALVTRPEDLLFPFAHLPKGTFYMGWGRSDENEIPILKGVKTEIKEDFEICLYDVTQGQWEAVMGKNPSHFARFGAGRPQVQDVSDEELKLFPVESVSWDDAQEFIKKLNELEKQGKNKWLYRLPTQPEWEYSCRGGATSEKECSYHFYLDKPTNDLSSKQANFNGNNTFDDPPKEPYLGRPTRVGAYPPNQLGLCDMHGNVFQWCGSSLASPRGARGGGWNVVSYLCHAGFRHPYAPGYRSSNLGFRLARVPVRAQDR